MRVVKNNTLSDIYTTCTGIFRGWKNNNPSQTLLTCQREIYMYLPHLRGKFNNGDDHLFHANAPMLKGILIVVHIIIVIVGIRKEVILHGKDIGRTDMGLGEKCICWFSYGKYVFGRLIIIQVFPLFITKVCGSRAVPNDATGPLYPNCTMICGQDNFYVLLA